MIYFHAWQDTMEKNLEKIILEHLEQEKFVMNSNQMLLLSEIRTVGKDNMEFLD